MGQVVGIADATLESVDDWVDVVVLRSTLREVCAVE